MIISFFICAWMGGYVERHVSKVVPIDVRWARPMHYFHGFLEVIPAKPFFLQVEESILETHVVTNGIQIPQLAVKKSVLW